MKAREFMYLGLVPAWKDGQILTVIPNVIHFATCARRRIPIFVLNVLEIRNFLRVTFVCQIGLGTIVMFCVILAREFLYSVLVPA